MTSTLRKCYRGGIGASRATLLGAVLVMAGCLKDESPSRNAVLFLQIAGRPVAYQPTGDTHLAGVAAVAGGRGALAVIDLRGAAVHVLSNADSSRASVFGRVGSGPGEFRAPRSARFDPSGHLWIGDVGRGRIMEFDTSGAVHREVSHPAPRSMAVTQYGIIALGPDPVRPLVLLHPDRYEFLGWKTEVPGVLADEATPWLPDRFLVDALDDSTVLLLDNIEVALWALRIQNRIIADVTEILLPDWLRHQVVEERERRSRALRLPRNARAVVGGFTSMHAAHGGVWLKPQSSRYLGMYLPTDDTSRIRLVLPRAGEHAGLIDSALLDDGRVILAYDTRVAVFALEPLENAQ